MWRACEVDADEPPATQPLTQPQGSQPSQQTPSEQWVARLVSMDTDYASRDLDLDEETTFGRRKECTVHMDDPIVSGMHCKVFYDAKMGMGTLSRNPMSPPFAPGKVSDPHGETFYGASNFWVEDFSSNGTFVNQLKVGRGKRVRLCHMDQISLCNSGAKKGTKGTKWTFVFHLNPAIFKQNAAFPPELLVRYDVRETLGTGGFSEVKMAIERSTGQMFAVKCLDKYKYTGGTRTGESLAREVDILKRLAHPNIIQVLDVVDTDRMLYIVLELAKGGELFDQIAQRGKHSEDEARFYFNQILLAVQYLHKNNICHRDLKPENILLESVGGRVKLTDFGFSRVVGEADMMKTLCGTPMYVAPEVMAMSMGIRDPTFVPSSGYGKSVDMWSLGVILYMLLCGAAPWPDLNFSNLCETVLKGVFEFPKHLWKGVSPAARQLVTALLTVSPSKRITVDEALQHPWITGEPMSPEVLPPASCGDGKENEEEVFVAPSSMEGITSKKRRYDSPGPETATTASSSEELFEEPEYGRGDEDEHDNNSGLMRLINMRAREKMTPHLTRDLSSPPSRVIPSTEATPILPTSNPNNVGTRLAFVESPGSSPTVRKLGFETPERKKPGKNDKK